MDEISENFESDRFTASNVTQKDAEAIAVSINMLFGNAKMFSPTHPSTEQAANTLCEKISFAAGKNPLISFIKSGKSFYVEKWIVDNKINQGRFTQDFGKLYIESISFAKGVSVRNVMDFIGVFISALENNFKADKIQEILEQKGENGIDLNYITFQKVAKGDKVVGANELVAVKDSGITYNFMANQTAEIPLDKILEINSEKSSEKINEKEENDEKTPKSVISHLEELFNIKNAIGTGKKDLHSINNELNTISAHIKEQRKSGNIDYDLLFSSLIDVSKIVKVTEYLFEEQDEYEKEKFNSQIDRLTMNAILEIIESEINQRKFSIKKLSLLVKRLDPSRNDLRRLLPQIKIVMVDNGLTISDYLNFVMELGNNLSEDKTVGKIFDNADDFGIAPSEIIDAFSQNPQESVKLLLQSAEIQKQHTSGINLSDYLSKMIDEISYDITTQKIKSKKIGGDVHSVISSVISSVNDGILEKFKKSGLDLKTTSEIQKKLMEKFPKTLENLKNEWLVNALGNSENLSQDAIIKVLTQVADINDGDDNYKRVLSKFSEKYNLSQNEITQILESVRIQKELLEQKNKLPLLAPKTTIHFIKRYIEEYKRHRHPFSIIMISNKNADSNETETPFNIAEKIAFLLSGSFRLLDISGFIKIREKEISVIILPMTASSGLNKVMEKIDKVIDTQKYIISSISYELPAKDEVYDVVMKKLLLGHI